MKNVFVYLVAVSFQKANSNPDSQATILGSLSGSHTGSSLACTWQPHLPSAQLPLEWAHHLAWQELTWQILQVFYHGINRLQNLQEHLYQNIHFANGITNTSPCRLKGLWAVIVWSKNKFLHLYFGVVQNISDSWSCERCVISPLLHYHSSPSIHPSLPAHIDYVPVRFSSLYTAKATGPFKNPPNSIFQICSLKNTHIQDTISQTQ